MKIFSLAVLLLLSVFGKTQNDFPYSVSLVPSTVDNLPGIHSFSFGQHNGYWVIIGGRLDGIHARQPFNAFPESDNNTDIFLVQPEDNFVKSVSVNSLPTGLKEQLQGTNFQFYQDGEQLIITGGYAFSETEGDHVTFPYLTTVDLPALIDDILNEKDIVENFKQLKDDYFAVTGGNLGKIDDEFYLIGGHRFDGRYNPMNHPTFVQTYTDAIRKFSITSSGTELEITKGESIVDQMHLHRRDYNLLPQIFPNGSFGYTIFSGVFQINQDLPFLYPVNIDASGYNPITDFNQYLSHYHSSKIALFDHRINMMHNLFFGGMSQYFYLNGNLIQDDDVPFVKTVSRVSRFPDGTMKEVKMSVEMPELVGAGAEFLLNEDLPFKEKDIIDLEKSDKDSLFLGYIYGGIHSPHLNPFFQNNTGVTTAYAGLFKVYLVSDKSSGTEEILLPGYHDFTINATPNPSGNDLVNLKIIAPESGDLEIICSDSNGKLIENVMGRKVVKGENNITVNLNSTFGSYFYVTAVLNGKYTKTEKVLVRK